MVPGLLPLIPRMLTPIPCYSFLLLVHLLHIALFRSLVLIPHALGEILLLHMNILNSFFHPNTVLIHGHLFLGEIFAKLFLVVLRSVLGITQGKKNSGGFLEV